MTIYRFSLLNGLKIIRSNGKHFVEEEMEEAETTFCLEGQMLISGFLEGLTSLMTPP